MVARAGLMQKGELNNASKLTTLQVEEIYAARDVTLTELGRRYGVTRQTISNIRNGHTWRDVTHGES